MPLQTDRAVAGLAESRVNGDAHHAGLAGRQTLLLQVESGFLRGREVVFAWLRDPEMMGLVIGGHHHLRDRQLLLLPEIGDNLSRQEVSVDDQVPRLLLEKPQEGTQVHLLQVDSQPIQEPQLTAFVGAVHQVIGHAQDQRRLVDA